MKLPETFRTVLKFSLAPFLAAAFYVLYALGTFGWPPLFIVQHLVVWVLVMVLTLLVASALYGLALWLRVPQPHQWAALVPAMGFTFLWLTYVLSIIGNRFWGETPTWDVVVRFAPEILHLADSFSIPRAVPLAVLFLPPLLVVFLYQWQSPGLRNLAEGSRGYLRRLRFSAGGALVILLFGWVSGALSISARNFGSDLLATFSHDPVVQLFKKQGEYFGMTPRRILANQQDTLAREQMVRQKPLYHNLFLFIVDAQRADHLPIYGYSRPLTPFLTAYFQKRGGRVLPWALSNSTDTRGGVPALLLSKSVPEMSAYNYTLSDFLSDQGFYTRMFLSGDHHWYGVNKTYGHSVGEFRDGVLNKGRDMGDDQSLVQNVEELPPDDGGYHFFYIHLMSVHQLGTFFNTFALYRPVLNLNPGTDLKPANILAINNLYDDRIRQMDDRMQHILEGLGKKGYLRDYLAVLTADHGQLLGEHGLIGHDTPFVYLDNLRIPVIFFGSRKLPPLPNAFGYQIDVAPTLVEMAGLKKPSSWRGTSLFQKQGDRWGIHVAPDEAPGKEIAVTYWHEGTLWKYSRRIRPSGGDPAEKLFNITRDPAETANLISSCPREFSQLFRDYLSKNSDD